MINALSICRSTLIPCNANYRATTVVDTYSIKSCVFSSLTSSGNSGGAVYISNSSSSLVVSLSLFYSCYTSSLYGSGIYFFGQDFNLTKSCGYRCYGSFDGQFLYVTASRYLDLIRCCVFQCGYSGSSSTWSSIRICSGIQKISGLNSSYNVVSSASGYQLYSPTSLDFSFATIFGCSTGDIINIYYLWQFTEYYTNYLNNSVASTSYLINMYNASLILSQCVIQGNSLTTMFTNNSNGLGATLISCYVQDSSSTGPVYSYTNVNWCSTNLVSHYGGNLSTNGVLCMFGSPSIAKSMAFTNGLPYSFFSGIFYSCAVLTLAVQND